MKWIAAILFSFTALAQNPLPPTNLAISSNGMLELSVLTWHAPIGWQTNGITFNVREHQDNQLIGCQVCWTLITNVAATNVSLIADPTKLRSISITNRFTGVEDNIGVSPVSQVFSRL